VFFKPIDNIRDFITEYVCDIQDKPDIASMQQNIQDYKHQEILAEKLEERLSFLEEIGGIYKNYNRTLELLNTHEYLRTKAELEIHQASIDKYADEVQNCMAELKDLIVAREKLSKETTELNELRDRLLTSEPYKEFEYLESKKEEITTESSDLMKKMEKGANVIRTEVFGWLKYCERLENAAWLGEIDSDILKKVSEGLPAFRVALQKNGGNLSE
jgi:hypothetical protein